jgi:hypothetical protein
LRLPGGKTAEGKTDQSKISGTAKGEHVDPPKSLGILVPRLRTKQSKISLCNLPRGSARRKEVKSCHE